MSLKDSWDEKYLKDVCNIFFDGDWIESKDQSSGGIRLVQTGNIGLGEYLDKKDSSRFISEETFIRLKCTEVFPGDLLVSRLPHPVGRSCVVPDIGCKMITGVDCTIIRPNNLLLVEFLKYFQMSNEYFKEIDSRVTGTTRSRISRKNLGLIKIPIPPLSEQKEIVAKLDKAFAAIDVAKANIEKNIENARELFQSRLNEIFSRKGDRWEEKRLGDVCSIESKLVDPTENEYLDMLHVGGGNIISKTGELIDLKTSREEGLKSGKFCFNEKMVLYNKIRPYLIKVCVPNFCGLCSADMYPLLPNDDLIKRDFLYFLLISKKFTDYAIIGSARAGMPKVNRKHLFDFRFYLPSIIEQEKFLVALDELMMSSQSIVSVYEDKIQILEELKKSLLQKAFAGKLT